jgi:plasmid stabilization system protein ParE
VTPRRLRLSARATQDLARRARVLSDARGRACAIAWTEAFLDWLDALATGGARLGTAHPVHARFRTFGYRRQATVLAEFADEELRVVRIYFAGQDWTAD